VTGNLATTNLLLGIMAAVSVVEALVAIGMAFGAWRLYQRATDLVETVEARHIAAVTGRVNAILDDVKDVTERVKEEARWVGGVRAKWQSKARRAVGVARGLRIVVRELLHAA
jgi:hypothetical protein